MRKTSLFDFLEIMVNVTGNKAVGIIAVIALILAAILKNPKSSTLMYCEKSVMVNKPK